MLRQFDLVIVGAGPVGCVIAERAATLRDWKCLIVERRKHVAGNCFDRFDESGVLVHQFGPHYFRTNSEALLAYLSRFTDWIPGNYIVKSYARGELFPFPISLVTLQQFFKRSFTAKEAAEYIEEIRSKIQVPRNSEEFVLSRVGKELYEAFYLGYTLKQWGRHPRDLDPSVCGRIPVRLSKDARYVDHRFQVTPKDGFTRLFERMIDHRNIRVFLEADYRNIRGELQPKVATVYCGPIDEYFDCRAGKLPWRSLHWEFRNFDKEFVQPCVQINYPWDHEYIRTVEIKHVTGQRHPQTVVSFEYPKDSGEPYYPVPATSSHALFRQYWQLAEEEKRKNKVFFAGRLATYRYMNTDEALEEGIAAFEEICRCAGK